MASKNNPVKKAARKKKPETDITNEIISQKPEEITIREFPWTEKQKELIDLILDKKTKVLFIRGCAGTAKSLVSVFCALKLLKEKKINEVVYLRSVVESSAKSIGFLPGDLNDKVSNFFTPLYQKLEELLPYSQIDPLVNSGVIKAISNQFLRGIQWRSFVIIDEAQGLEKFELTTILTRLAEGGTMIFIGDEKQADIKRSGFMEFFNLFDNDESRARGIHNFTFGKEDIMRSKILSFICDKIETLN